MAFHRLSVPLYFGGLPAGFDYVNNAIVGIPAFADGQKGAGPNVGTYFIAFGEDATSSDANRPNKALAENTDYLDDLMRRDLAIPQKLEANAGAPVASLVFPAGTFVGVGGTPNTPEGIMTFVKILDQNENEVEVAGVACKVTSIAGAVVGTGFSAGNVTFNIAPSIPTGIDYRIFYANRGNLATMPADVFTTIKIRSSQELPAAFEDFVKQIAREGGLDVLALVATIFETPDGTRLAKSGAMAFDADPDGTVGGVHSFKHRIARDAAPVTLLEANDDPALGGAATGRYKWAAGLCQEFLGTGLLRDVNIAAGAANGGPFLPWTSSALGFGDQYLRVFEKGSVGSAITPTILRAINGRWTCTVGDGTNSFGDFSGANAIQQAIAYFNAQGGGTTLHIKLKRGAYSLTNVSGSIVLSAGWDVTLEGVGSQDTIITATTTAAGVQLANNVRLRLKSLQIHRTAGSLAVVASNAATSGSRVYAQDCVFSEMQFYALNPGVAVATSTTAKTHLFQNCKFTETALGAPMLVWEVGDADTQAHSGFLYEDCVFYSADTNQPIARVQAHTASVITSFMHDLRFRRCDFYTGSSTVVGNNPVGNSGPIEFSDNGTGGSLALDELHYEDCNVFAGAGSAANATTTLLHIYGLSAVSIGLIHIEGGKWLNYKVNPAIVPFFITGISAVAAFSSAPQKVIWKDVTTGWAAAGDYTGTGTTVGTTYGIWPAAIAAGLLTAEQAAYFIGGPDAEVKNITFVGTASVHSLTGLLWCDSQQSLDVDGVFAVPSQGGSGGASSRWVAKFTPSLGAGLGSLFFAKKRRVASVLVEGFTTGQYSLVVVPFGRLEVEHCTVTGNTAGTASVVMPLTDAAYTLAAGDVAGLKVRKNHFVDNSQVGFFIHHDGSAPLPGIVADLELSNNVATGNGATLGCGGIGVLCDDGAAACAFPGMMVHNNSAHGNTGFQIAAFPSAFQGAGPSVVGNHVTHAGASDGIGIGTQRAAGDNPAFSVQGNSLRKGTGFGAIAARLIGGAAFPTDESGGTGLQLEMRGIEVGWVPNGGVNYRQFAAADGSVRMAQNFAGLQHLA